MRYFGLIGFPLSHSFSKRYFSQKFESEKIAAQYENYPLKSIEEFPELVRNYNFSGINVTIPYKQDVMQYLDNLSEEAEKIGAVNTIQIRNEKLIGNNTDCYGFEMSLLPFLKPSHKHALVLGTGGASKAVVFVLEKLGIDWKYVSRTKSNNGFTYEELDAEIIKSHYLIINTTPLGMYPNVEECPEIDYDAIGENHLLYDLVYNPEETLFLQKGKSKGATIKNGLEMLHLQAEKAWEIWNS
jgi:shikimate dehydrogenase